MRVGAGEQLAFELAHRPALDASDFLVSDCNQVAVALIDAWPDWPTPVQLLIGPPGSGKSHLAQVWRHASGARLLEQNADLESALAAAPLVIEDVDRDGYEDRLLFHLLNIAAEHRQHILMTARSAPVRWPYRLPDLTSRLKTIAPTAIGAPDDALLQAVLIKHFYDRQLNVAPAVVLYVARRIERSLAAAGEAVRALDRAALAARSPITRRFAAQVLEFPSYDDD